MNVHYVLDPVLANYVLYFIFKITQRQGTMTSPTVKTEKMRHRGGK